MICPRCGAYMPSSELTCESCGTFLSNTEKPASEMGVRAIRQGKHNSSFPLVPDSRRDLYEYGDYDMSPLPPTDEHSPRRKTPPIQARGNDSRPAAHRGVPIVPRGRTGSFSARNMKPRFVKKRAVNWARIGFIGLTILILAGSGAFFYIRGSDEGLRRSARRIVASVNESMLTTALSKDEPSRSEREAALDAFNRVPAPFYWFIGQEYLDMGDVETAITSFRIAIVLEPENYDGLLLLANAYELNAMDDEAEAIYLKLIQTIAPPRAEAYTALIRMYLEQNRSPEAADIMLAAYHNTDRETFRLQRSDFIPLLPQVDLPAGRYEKAQTIQLTSPQGYDIYYTLDNSVALPVLGVLPDGWLFSEDGTFLIPEGTLTLRALCKSQDLVSDPLSVTYTVFYPSPSAPYANLAPGTYTRPLTVKLRPGSREDEREHKTNPLIFYYTIDGSTPTEESPVFDGAPIKLPSGKVTLRAVCVNQYGKMSSTREVDYKFNISPAPLAMYSREDQFDGFVLNSTSIERFTARFGAPQNETQTRYLYMDAEARLLEYGWGHAVFILVNNQWGLVRVEMNADVTLGPRGVGIGNTEDEVAAAYKDMGQVQSPNGNRGLYYADPHIGRILQNSDGTRTIQYSCRTLEGRIWILQYHLRAAQVYQIVHYYQP